MVYTVDSTTATSATLSNLWCNTRYTVWVYAQGGTTGKGSISRTVILQGTYVHIFCVLLVCYLLAQRMQEPSQQVFT